MTVAGASLAAIAVVTFLLALRRASAVGRRLELVAPMEPARRRAWHGASDQDVRHSGVALDADQLLAVRVVAALGCATAAALASLALQLGPLVPIAAGYVGAVVPPLWIAARARARRAEAEAATILLVERLDALMAAGRPPETALAVLMRHPTGSVLLDVVMARAAEAHLLGAPIFRTVTAYAREEGLATCALVAMDLERARDLGTGALAVLGERRRSLRAAERARRLETASGVEGKLMLVLVLCYLPALALLVVIPLFIGLLEGLFA